MTTKVRVSEDLVKRTNIYSKLDKRSVAGQIEYWAMIGKYAEENPDLTYSLIKEIFISLAELDQSEYSEYELRDSAYRLELSKLLTGLSLSTVPRRFSASLPLQPHPPLQCFSRPQYCYFLRFPITLRQVSEV